MELPASCRKVPFNVNIDAAESVKAMLFWMVMFAPIVSVFEVVLVMDLAPPVKIKLPDVPKIFLFKAVPELKSIFPPDPLRVKLNPFRSMPLPFVAGERVEPNVNTAPVLWVMVMLLNNWILKAPTPLSTVTV